MAQKRVLYFDILNILACLGVIFLHSNGLAHFFSPTRAWLQALFIEVVCYWAVPVFFMLSGANLMDFRERYSVKTFFRKRFSKILLPLMVWFLLSAVDLRVNPFDKGLSGFTSLFFTPRLEYVYWFFFPLIAIYLSLPVLSLLKDHRTILWYLALGALALNSLTPDLFAWYSLEWNPALSMPMASGYLVFPILGYLFAQGELTKKQRLAIYILGVAAAVFRYMMIVRLSYADGETNHFFFHYNSFYSAMLAVAVFVFIKYSTKIKKIEKNEKLVKIITTVSGCSFGIYLMHMIIMRHLTNYLNADIWQWRLYAPFLIFTIALVLTLLIKKIPLVNKIVP